MQSMKYFCALVLILLFAASEVSGQVANSFEQLQVLVKPGDRVSVTDVNGTLSQGMIAELSRSTLRLAVAGAPRDLSEADVVMIRQRRRDSLANGAIIGAVAGGAFGLLPALLVCFQETNCAGSAVGAVSLFTAMGTGIGVGIDALIVRQQTIYRRGTSGRLDVKPIFSAGRKGVAFTVSF